MQRVRHKLYGDIDLRRHPSYASGNRMSDRRKQSIPRRNEQCVVVFEFPIELAYCTERSERGTRPWCTANLGIVPWNPGENLAAERFGENDTYLALVDCAERVQMGALPTGHDERCGLFESLGIRDLRV